MLRRLILVGDLAALALAIAAAQAYRQWAGEGGASLPAELLLLAVGTPLWLMLAHAHNLFHVGRRRADHAAAEELAPIFQMVTLWSWIMLIAAAAVGAGISIPAAVILWGTGIVMTVSLRSAIRAWARRRDWYIERALLVGTPFQIAATLEKIRRHPEYGIEVVAGVDPFATEAGRAHRIDSIPVISGEVDIGALVERLPIDRLLVASWPETSERRSELFERLSEAHVHVDLVPTWFEILGTKLEVHQMEGTPLLRLPYTELGGSSRLMKRAFDAVAAVTLLLLLLPVLAACAVAIKLGSPGPVFFRQRRIGKDGRPFELLKFRSMYDSADQHKAELVGLTLHPHGGKGMFKIREDPRVTPFGRWLRRTSMDELPQLINVVRGEMSLVGPRPLIESEHRQVEGRYRRRQSLTPGLTGLWQVQGRSEIPFETMVNLDFIYVTTWSLWGDVKILLQTASAIISRRGAY
jgi:exopolysaccharide biosynthesis polyprenyl glycosylphosphotransferase